MTPNRETDMHFAHSMDIAANLVVDSFNYEDYLQHVRVYFYLKRGLKQVIMCLYDLYAGNLSCPMSDTFNKY